MVLLAIDTGTAKSAYVMVDTNTYKIEESGKVDNEKMMEIVRFGYYDACVIEMFSSYGMRVGKEVFESVVVVGQIMEAVHYRGIVADRIERQKVKQYVVGKGGNVKDADVIRVLKDRFGDKGTKKNPGFFFGTTSDIWQAFALAVAYIDMKKEGVDMYAL